MRHTQKVLDIYECDYCGASYNEEELCSEHEEHCDKRPDRYIKELKAYEGKYLYLTEKDDTEIPYYIFDSTEGETYVTRLFHIHSITPDRMVYDYFQSHSDRAALIEIGLTRHDIKCFYDNNLCQCRRLSEYKEINRGVFHMLISDIMERQRGMIE